MGNRPIQYSQEQARSYDFLWGWRDMLIADGYLEQDLTGATTTVVSGLAGTQTGSPSLVINIAAGRIYENAEIDATSYGSLTSDTATIQQQGIIAGQTVTLSTSGLSAGQSRWALIQVTWTQADIIPGDDPTGGLLYYYNSASPSTPYQGPGDDGDTQATQRQSTGTIGVIYGAAATTGSEAPPNPSANYVPLYLIDLAFGQTAVTNGQIITAGPSVGTNVPNNYPYAPFMAGLLNSHHNGTTGQAPKINLATEVQGNLPLGNLAVQFGQCYLSLSGSNLILAPLEGNNLTFVAGNATIPSSGVTLAPTSLAASTFFYIYAVQTAGVVTSIEASTTVPLVNAATGIKYKTGDTTRTLVGAALTTSVPAWVDSGSQIGVLSYFNRKNKSAINTPATATTTSTSAVEISTGARTNFITFGDESIICAANSNVTNNTGGDTVSQFLGADGLSPIGLTQVTSGTFSVGAQVIATTTFENFAAGAHYVTIGGLVSGGTGTWLGSGGFGTGVVVRG